MYMADDKVQVLPIKDLINVAGKMTMPFKLVTSSKASIFHLLVIFCPCVVPKDTEHVGTKVLKNRHRE